ncbi:MAG: hypothetical protein KKA76_10055, partial [Proteobacteria bacterium]|nr:hypothetical protein [Pseudomonadota bacterium]
IIKIASFVQLRSLSLPGIRPHHKKNIIMHWLQMLDKSKMMRTVANVVVNNKPGVTGRKSMLSVTLSGNSQN